VADDEGSFLNSVVPFLTGILVTYLFPLSTFSLTYEINEKL
jgi:hypothetical protein